MNDSCSVNEGFKQGWIQDYTKGSTEVYMKGEWGGGPPRVPHVCVDLIRCMFIRMLC